MTAAAITLRLAGPDDARAIAMMSRDLIEAGLGWKYDPARIARWWGPAGFTNTIHTFDFRPGGEWRRSAGPCHLEAANYYLLNVGRRTGQAAAAPRGAPKPPRGRAATAVHRRSHAGHRRRGFVTPVGSGERTGSE